MRDERISYKAPRQFAIARQPSSNQAGRMDFRHPGHQALRIGRWSLPGQIYHVTTTTKDRRSWFADATVASAAARALSSSTAGSDDRILCWVLMPDHLHILLELGRHGDLARIVNRIKSLTAKAVNLRCATRGQVWARAYHDHALRKDEDALVVARYIIGNPVRAGIVTDPSSYPWWDAVWLSDPPM